MEVERWSGRVIGGPLTDVYVYQAPVRIWHWVTMNVVLMPRVSAAWQVIGARETRRHVFPGGVFEFIGAREATLGDYQACSLCSPMFEFADQRESRATALAALDALFDPASREAAPVRAAQASSVATAASAETAPMLSKRDFRFGATPRGDRGP